MTTFSDNFSYLSEETESFPSGNSSESNDAFLDFQAWTDSTDSDEPFSPSSVATSDESPKMKAPGKQSRRIKKQSRESYKTVSNQARQQLIFLVESCHLSLKAGTEALGINYSTGKSILTLYRREGRILKKVNCGKSTPVAVESKRGAPSKVKKSVAPKIATISSDKKFSVQDLGLSVAMQSFCSGFQRPAELNKPQPLNFFNFDEAEEDNCHCSMTVGCPQCHHALQIDINGTSQSDNLFAMEDFE